MFQIVSHVRSIRLAGKGLRPAAFLLTFGATWLLMGGVVDFIAASNSEKRLQAAAESIASALVPDARSLSARGLQLRAERLMALSLASEDGAEADVNVTVVGTSVRVSATTRLSTIFLRIINRPSLPIESTATARPPKAAPRMLALGYGVSKVA